MAYLFIDVSLYKRIKETKTKSIEYIREKKKYHSSTLGVQMCQVTRQRNIFIIEVNH